MEDMDDLNIQERIFLAGCIKALILADEHVSDEELVDLERINSGLGFADFDDCLAQFEKNVKTEADFEFLARNIYHEKTRSLITRILWDLALQEGYATPDEEAVIRQLQAWWK